MHFTNVNLTPNTCTLDLLTDYYSLIMIIDVLSMKYYCFCFMLL